MGAGIIKFLPGLAGTIQLTSALPNLSKNIEINGPGANALTVRRNSGGDYRILTIDNGTNAGPTVTICGLTITNGSAIGGGIYNDHGTVTVLNCVLSGNTGGGFIGAGGIYADGNGSGSAATHLRHSTFSGNNAPGAFGGGAYNSANGTGSATMSVENCTFSANSANNGGAGIFNFGGNAAGNATLTVLNTTFFGQNGQAIFNDKDGTGTAALTIGNTILKHGVGANFANDGTITSQGHNLSSDGAGGSFGPTGPGGHLNATGDKRSTDPLLDVLADNGGPTPTHAMMAGSQAINMGSDVLAPGFDQRYYLRAGVADIGAFEFGGAPIRITSINRLANQHIMLEAQGVSNAAYTLKILPDLESDTPTFVSVNANSSGLIQYDDDGAVGQTKRFYQVLVLP